MSNELDIENSRNVFMMYYTTKRRPLLSPINLHHGFNMLYVLGLKDHSEHIH